MRLATALLVLAAFAIPGVLILINGPFKYSGDTYYLYGGIDPIELQNWFMGKIGIMGTAIALIAVGILGATLTYRGAIK